MIAASERQSASRRCSGSASTSPSWSETSTCAIAARESASVDVAVTPPLLIESSPHLGPGTVGGLALEPDRAVGQIDTREDTRPVRDHVVRPDRHALAEHGATGDLASR